MNRPSLAFVVATVLLTTGCYSTRITNGKAPAAPQAAWDERQHHGVVVGLGEISGPYDLNHTCPGGWAVVETHTSFRDVVSELFSMGIYSPQTITVRCDAAPAPKVWTPPHAPTFSPPPPPTQPAPPPPAPPAPPNAVPPASM